VYTCAEKVPDSSSDARLVAAVVAAVARRVAPMAPVVASPNAIRAPNLHTVGLHLFTQKKKKRDLQTLIYALQTALCTL